MRTEKMTGYFDARTYQKNVDHRDRRIAPDGSNITFVVSYAINAVPAHFMVGGKLDEFARPYASKGEREVAQAQGRQPVCDRVSVQFKICSNCRWFDKYGEACSRPTNAMLDDGQYEVMIDFSRRERKPNDQLSPCGYWANAIMFKRVADNPFNGVAFERDERPADVEVQQVAMEQPAQAHVQQGSGNGLPF